jgi:hypothetical protein
MADTYSLLYIAQKLDKGLPSQEEASFLRESIIERPWRGGGSYLSFYGGMKEESRSVHPLRVAGIEYHSPGFMDLAGKREVLDEIVTAIDEVIIRDKGITKLYSAIRKALRSEDLLTAGREKKFSNKAIEDYVHRQTLALADAVSLPNGDKILEACDSDVAVFAKLVLSDCRRLKSIATFFVEGRANVA